MKEITGINHIGLRVSDLAKAREFYEKPVGWGDDRNPNNPNPPQASPKLPSQSPPE